jgi:hypothetical protein
MQNEVLYNNMPQHTSQVGEMAVGGGMGTSSVCAIAEKNNVSEGMQRHNTTYKLSRRDNGQQNKRKQGGRQTNGCGQQA